MSDLFYHKDAKPLDVEISQSDTSSERDTSASASERRDSASDGSHDSASDLSGPDDHEGGFLDSLVGLSFQPQPGDSPKVIKSIHL